MAGYPQSLPPQDHIEPAPRRVRGMLGGRTVFDTDDASYVWEWPHYPQYYIPLADIDPDVLVDEQHTQRLHRGTARTFGLRVGDEHRPGAARVFGPDAMAGLCDLVRFDWAALDAWFEEDEQIFVHPRDPYTRVDALRSTQVYGSSSKARCWLNPLPRSWCSRPACHPLLPEPDRGPVRAAGPERNRHRLPVQGHHQFVLVGPGR